MILWYNISFIKWLFDWIRNVWHFIYHFHRAQHLVIDLLKLTQVWIGHFYFYHGAMLKQTQLEDLQPGWNITSKCHWFQCSIFTRISNILFRWLGYSGILLRIMSMFFTLLIGHVVRTVSDLSRCYCCGSPYPVALDVNQYFLLKSEKSLLCDRIYNGGCPTGTNCWRKEGRKTDGYLIFICY